MYKNLCQTTFCCFLASLLLWPLSGFSLTYEDYPVVRLRSLDKITARTMTFDAKVGSSVKFGDIFIKIQSCRKPPPVEKNEAASFLQIWQPNKADGGSSWVFSGWMFSSSPTLSAMDHPIYDVWVLDCLGKNPEELPPAEPAEAEEGAQNSSGLPEGTVPVDRVQEPSQSPEEQKTLPRPDLPSDSGEVPLEQEHKPSPPEQEEEPLTNEIPADDSSPSSHPATPSPFEGIY